MNLRAIAISTPVFKRLALGSIAVLAAPLFAQPGAGPRQPLIDDWSQSHVVFTNSNSPQVAAANQKNPRYWLQLLRRNASSLQQNTSDKKPPSPSGVDWSVSLGNNGTKV